MIPYVVVYLLCQWEKVNSESSYATILKSPLLDIFELHFYVKRLINLFINSSMAICLFKNVNNCHLLLVIQPDIDIYYFDFRLLVQVDQRVL